MRQVDYLIVGSGLTGATIARMLADAGLDVLVVDRRSCIGGNVADQVHNSGIRFNSWGPHYFRASSDRIWEFASRFSDFYPFAAEVRTRIDGVEYPWPVHSDLIEKLAGKDWKPAFTGTPTNFEEQALSLMPRVVYEKSVKPYTENQWGVPAATLSASLARRFDIRTNGEVRLTPNAKYQGLPVGGYSAWVEKMLWRIPVHLEHDHLVSPEYEAKRKLIFTGPIDEYYKFDLGKLAYRSQSRHHTWHPNVDFVQSCVQVNNPAGPHIRSIEWKHAMRVEEVAGIRGTLVTDETPYFPTNPDRYEYPFPDATGEALYSQYRKRAEADSRIVFCGRLGKYVYADMDASLAGAMKVAEKLIEESQRG